MAFPSEHPVTAWLVEHVSDVLTKYLVGADGHSAYERLFGKQAREEGLEFGERVLYRKRRGGDMNVVLDGRWEPVIWLGRRWGSGTHRVHANGKVIDVRSVQRRPALERWSATELAAVRATPWRTSPGPAGEDEELVVLQPLPRAEGAAVPAARPDLGVPRRVYIRKAAAAALCVRAPPAQASPTSRCAANVLSAPCAMPVTSASPRPRRAQPPAPRSQHPPRCQQQRPLQQHQ